MRCFCGVYCLYCLLFGVLNVFFWCCWVVLCYFFVFGRFLLCFAGKEGFKVCVFFCFLCFLGVGCIVFCSVFGGFCGVVWCFFGKMFFLVTCFEDSFLMFLKTGFCLFFWHFWNVLFLWRRMCSVALFVKIKTPTKNHPKKMIWLHFSFGPYESAPCGN